LGVVLVDPELAPPRARPPVDPPDPVARCERAEVGELDPLAFHSRDLVSREDLRLERADEVPERLGPWVDLQRPGELQLLLVDEKAERIARPDRNLSDDVG